MGSNSSSAKGPSHGESSRGTSPPPSNLHENHLAAQREHAAWLAELERWRREYREAVRAFAHRIAPELELENYETALERHEAAIQAHKEILARHERALREAGASPDLFAGLHQQLERRHARSALVHQQLERTHRALIAALRMLAGAQP